MLKIHMNPAEAVLAHLALHSSQSIAIHFGTFHLSEEGLDEPVRDLKAALSGRNVPAGSFVVLPLGQTLEQPARVTP